MTSISIEKQLLLYDCLLETMQILNLNSFNKIFYCGSRLKYNIPNTLLIIVDDDVDNIYFNEINCEEGARGSAYLNKSRIGSPWDIQNRKFTFHYKVISQLIYDRLNNDWNKLADESWIYLGNMEYIPGIDITDSMQRYYQLKCFA